MSGMTSIRARRTSTALGVVSNMAARQSRTRDHEPGDGRRPARNGTVIFPQLIYYAIFIHVTPRPRTQGHVHRLRPFRRPSPAADGQAGSPRSPAPCLRHRSPARDRSATRLPAPRLPSLFDYVKRGLGYSDAATWRRINAMKLCARIGGVRERLWDGSLTLDAAAQLQAAFERHARLQRRERERARPARGTGVGSAPRPNGSARPPARSAQGKPALEPGPGPILDVSA